MASDQAEADEDLSFKQRAMVAMGSTLEGASEMVGNEALSGAMEFGGWLACLINFTRSFFNFTGMPCNARECGVCYRHFVVVSTICLL